MTDESIEHDTPADYKAALPPTCGPDSAFKGKPGRSGPPKGNRNALRHGLRAGTTAKGCKYLQIRANTVRRYLEDACLRAFGEVNEERAATIRAITDMETHRGFVMRTLRLKADQLDLKTQLWVSEQIAKASACVADKIAKLGLDAEPPAPWSIDLKLLTDEGSDDAAG